MEIPEITTNLYRGKCTPDSKFAGEWVCGGVVYCEKTKQTLIVSALTDKVTFTYHVIPESVGVFILKYKQLKIFEGDIIHLKTDTIDRDFGVVVHHPYGAYIVDDYFGAYDITDRSGKPIGATLQHIELLFKGQKCEISINGNITDRPEVMKKNVVPF